MSEHYPQDNACRTCLGMMLVVCDRCDGKGCKHCSLIDCQTCQTDTHAVDWRARCLAAEARIKGCAAALAEIERAHPDSLDDYSKGFRHGCQDMIAILYGEP
jgi:hypothetical protein